MGMVMAPEVSDITLLALAELPFAASTSVQSQFGILYFRRFKDDLLFIADFRVAWAAASTSPPA